MLIVSNWKAYVEDLAKAKRLSALAKRLAGKTRHAFVLAPPAPFLGILAKGNRSKVRFAAQDVSATTGGAHTGEATACAFVNAGAHYAIIGHSERRAAGDTNEIVAGKLSHALAQGLTPILCVGERARDGGATYLGFVREEIASALATVSAKERAQVVIAYEPLWAIGKTAADAIGPRELSEMILYIRKVLAEYLPGKSAARAKVLYGGSVEPGNARELAAGAEIDGFLIGHASAEPESIAAVVQSLS